MNGYHPITASIMSPNELGIATTPGPADRVLATWLRMLKPTSITAYTTDLRHCCTDLGLTERQVVERLLDRSTANELMIHWVESMERRGLSASAQRRRFAAARALVKTGRLLGLCVHQIEIAPQPIDPEQVHARNLGPKPAVVQQLFAAAASQPKAFKAKRDTAILSLLFYRALRASEVASLTVGGLHLDEAEPYIVIQAKKRREPVRVVLTEPTVSHLKTYAAERGTNPDGPMFLSEKGAPLNRFGIWHIIKSLGQGITDDDGRPLDPHIIRPHGLRHTALTILAERQHDLTKVAAFARVRDTRTVEIYRDFHDDPTEEMGGLLSSIVDPNR